jgi:mRNA interferase MazF
MPFPFADLSDAKRRPAFVIAVLQNDDVVLCQITSQARKDPYVVELSTTDLEDGTLNKASWIRPNRLFTADPSVILYRLGRVKTEVTDAVIRKVIEIVQSK